MDNPRIEILTGDELLEQYWEVPANSDLFGDIVRGREVNRLKYLDGSEVRKETHITLFIGDRIVGVGGLEPSAYEGESRILWLKHVSVEEQYQGNGFGRIIEEAVYAYALAHGKKIHHQTFKPMGTQRLRQVVQELDERYPQCICDCWYCVKRGKGVYDDECDG